jgi:hypothetical protein
MHRRITLINAADRTRDWAASDEAPSRIVFASLLSVIRQTFDDPAQDEDIERVIVDQTATADDFLELLAHISPDFPGDVIFIGEGDRAYVSSAGRGAGRLLYAMRPHDLRFYLETHGLIAPSSVAAA